MSNAIERAFGVVKKCFPIIGSSTELHYGLETQKKIIFACCILQNYLMCVDPDDDILAQIDIELAKEAPEEHHISQENTEETMEEELIRDAIAAEMCLNYNE